TRRNGDRGLSSDLSINKIVKALVNCENVCRNRPWFVNGRWDKYLRSRLALENRRGLAIPGILKQMLERPPLALQSTALPLRLSRAHQFVGCEVCECEPMIAQKQQLVGNHSSIVAATMIFAYKLPQMARRSAACGETLTN